MNEINHFEIMEELGQINMFELMKPASNEVKCVVQLQSGDKVQCIITEESDSDSYNYFKYYHPYVLSGVGEIERIEKGVLSVRYKNEIVLLNPHEVTL